MKMFCILCAAILLATASFAPAARAEDEPAAGIPDEALFYLHIRDLAALVDRTVGTGAFDLFSATTLARESGLVERFDEWRAMRDELEPEVGFDPWTKLVDALGGRWGLAGWEANGEEIEGVMFAQPTTPGATEQFMRASWDIDRRAGEIMDIEETEVGRSRLINVIRGENKSDWFVFGPNVTLTGDSRETLERSLAALEGGEGNLAGDERYKIAINALGDRDFFAWMDFGRAASLDMVDFDFGEGTPPIITMLRDGAVSYGAIGAYLLEDRLDADFLLQLRPELMSPPLRDLARTPVSGTSGVWSMIPASEIAVQGSSRLPVRKRIDALRWAMEDDQRAEFDRTLSIVATLLGGLRMEDFLDRLGPETSLVVLKPAEGDTGLPDALFFIQLAPDQRFRRQLGGSLNTVLSLVTALTLRAVEGDGQPMRAVLRQLRHQGVEFGALALSGGELPEGLEFCYGIIGNFLVISSTPRAMTRLIDSSSRSETRRIPAMLQQTRNHADLLYVEVEPALAAATQLMDYLLPMIRIEMADDEALELDVLEILGIIREAAAPMRSVVAHTTYTERAASMKLLADVDWSAWERYRAEDALVQAPQPAANE